VYVLAEGPLAAAILAWRCAWIPGSPDHTIRYVLHSLWGSDLNLGLLCVGLVVDHALARSLKYRGEGCFLASLEHGRKQAVVRV
jgi:hypothetical protein